jgi:hypothetical protein
MIDEKRVSLVFLLWVYEGDKRRRMREGMRTNSKDLIGVSIISLTTATYF